MSLGPLLLLCSALLHAAWNALAKTTKDKESFLFLTILLSGLITLVLVLSGSGFQIPNATATKIAILSGVLEGLYFLSLSKALNASTLGASYAIMRGGAMVVVWLISSIFLGEAFHTRHFAGAFLILSGILVMNGGQSGLLLNLGWQENKWSYLSAVFIAGYHLCYHQALVYKAETKSLFCVAMLVSLPFLAWGLRNNPVNRIKLTLQNHGKRVVTTGAAATASFLIFLYGLEVTAPGLAISLRNSSIFFAVIFSLLLKEAITRYQIIGATTVGLGALLLSL
ncbi:EamA family transporter [Bdellovibrio bacteriovorus]